MICNAELHEQAIAAARLWRRPFTIYKDAYYSRSRQQPIAYGWKFGRPEEFVA